MMNKPRPPHRAIVQGALESYLDPNHPSNARVILSCGHCGAYIRTPVTLCYHDPKECGISYEDQTQDWADSLSSSMSCPKCKVLNVAVDVETYLRQQRKLAIKLKNLLRHGGRKKKPKGKAKPPE